MAAKTKSVKDGSKKKGRESAAAGQKAGLGGKGRRLTGVVVSDKMTRTVVVEVTRLVSHPLYKKRVRKVGRFHADNTAGAKEGDWVEIVECPPISKLKHFTVSSIVKRG